MEKLFLVVFFLAVNPDLRLGNCRSCVVKNFPVVQNFDVDRYVGRWYEQEVTLFPGQPDALRLRKLVSTVTAITPTIQSTYGIGREPATGECKEELLICRLTKPPKGYFNITFITVPEPRTSEFTMVATNYVGYVVYYGCFDINRDGTCNTPFVITETRTPRKTRRDARAINRILNRLCIDRRLLVRLRVGRDCPEPELKQCRQRKRYYY